jgi:hypothetical protein
MGTLRREQRVLWNFLVVSESSLSLRPGIRHRMSGRNYVFTGLVSTALAAWSFNYCLAPPCANTTGFSRVIL